MESLHTILAAVSNNDTPRLDTTPSQFSPQHAVFTSPCTSPTGRDSPNSFCIPQQTQHARFMISFVSRSPMLFSLLRCEVRTHMRAKQLPTPPPPLGTFTRSLTRTVSLQWRGVQNSTKSSVADRTGAFTMESAFRRGFTVPTIEIQRPSPCAFFLSASSRHTYNTTCNRSKQK